jgi:hypothetical protein
MIMLASADVVCTARQLGDVLGVTNQQVERLARAGVLKPVRCKLKGRRYRLSDSVQSYLKYQRESVKAACASSNGAYNDARTRRMNALAAIEEARARQVSGEPIKRSIAVDAMSSAISIVKSHVLAIANRCARMVVGQTDLGKVHSAIHNECVLSLREIANFDVNKLEPKHVGAGNGADDDDS